MNQMETIVWYKKQDDLFKSLPDAPCYWVQYLNENGAMRFSGGEFEQFAKLCESDNHIGELIKHDRPRKFYIDWEVSHINKLAGLSISYRTQDEQLTEICNIISSIVDDFSIHYEGIVPVNTTVQCLVAKSTESKKLSIHACIPEWITKDCEDCKLLAENFITFCRENEDYRDISTHFHIHEYFDGAVYDKNRKMRFLNQNKVGQLRPFRPSAQSSTDMYDHMITFINADSHTPIKIPKSFIKPKPNLRLFQENVEVCEDINDDEELRLLCVNTKYLGDKSEASYDRQNWVKWIYAMISAGVSYDDIHTFSYEADTESYTQKAVDDLIKGFSPERTTMGRHTLKYLAKLNGFDVDREVDKVPTPLPVRREDHMLFIDLTKKWHGRTFTNDIPTEFLNDINHTVQYIQAGQCLFSMYTRHDEQFDLTKKIPKLSFSIRIGEGEKAKLIQWTLQKYMIEYPLKFPLYNHVVFKPNVNDVRRGELNTWTGFKAHLLSDISNPEDVEIINTFTKHVREVWANESTEVFGWLMSWIAQIIQTPHKPTDVAIMLQGGQGIGKTILCDILINKVFGRNLSLSACGLSSLTSRFNGSIRGKLFTKVDEISLVDSSEFTSAFDKMKTLITDRMIQIEHKGLEHMQIDNLNNFIFTTNHIHTLKLETDDRRYACFECSDRYKNNYDYFEHLDELLNNDHAGDVLFTYFKQYSNLLNLKRIPKTALKEEITNLSKLSALKFMDEIDQIDSLQLYDYITVDGVRSITVVNLHTQYSIWCTENKEKCYGKSQFMSMIKPFITNKGRNRVNGVATLWVQLKS